jgi:hypothetical protein
LSYKAVSNQGKALFAFMAQSGFKSYKSNSRTGVGKVEESEKRLKELAKKSGILMFHKECEGGKLKGRKHEQNDNFC